MPRIIDILDLVIEEIKKQNPYGLILKGGTALALHHLERHRESEDLDFDVPYENKTKHGDIVLYLKDIFEKLVENGSVYGVEFHKEGFAKTDRYHMKILIKTHPRDEGHLTKIDIDYIQEPDEIKKIDDLGFYKVERMMISKLRTFSSRLELKDFFDIFHLIKSIDRKDIKDPEPVVDRIDKILKDHDEEELLKIFKKQWKAMDLRFRSLKGSQLKGFIKKVFRELRRFRNELSK